MDDGSLMDYGGGKELGLGGMDTNTNTGTDMTQWQEQFLKNFNMSRRVWQCYDTDITPQMKYLCFLKLGGR